MSRTDVHAPLWVRMCRREVAVEADHDHRDGICDLPERVDSQWVEPPTCCTWEFVHTGIKICSCDLCRDKVGHRLDLRRERRNAATRLDRKRRQWELGNRSVFDDVVVPHRNRDWW